MERRSQENNSRLVFALDLVRKELNKSDFVEKCLNILEKTELYIAGVKIGYPLVLDTDLEIISKISEVNNVPIIADFKIADVPHISKQIAKLAFKAGADAVISHGFTGDDSLGAIIEACEEENKGVLVVSNMSHPGGEMFIQPMSEKILNLAKEAKATGIIGPATRPEQVEKLRKKAGEELLILTPGIGAQGGRPGDAIKNGADYEIVGRAIYQSESPGKSAENIRDTINETLKEED
ncbi:hypothetical protein AKJ50_01250 [candidate division MSBL1 archaeon SCGC-AAA382A13]|uniref:Orotidine 5'-phosphate decarboxylase n=1 Tax=candidate division MSBL1 archaeon SCGC-AAA382A13 TaxID=1698279 RepID=A0A133VFV3_9EURY|nr:hypothetical protein AKJ50_01250 [candidate division MSBL1 archaeon SCGC-AAA382A13]